MNMKKTAFKTLALIFTVLTLLGSLYVLLQRGQVSPGYDSHAVRNTLYPIVSFRAPVNVQSAATSYRDARCRSPPAAYNPA